MSLRTFNCEVCGKQVATTAYNQKYCPECRLVARKAKGEVWYRQNILRKKAEKERAKRQKKPLTLEEINRKALAEGLSYGKYVVKYHL